MKELAEWAAGFVKDQAFILEEGGLQITIDSITSKFTCWPNPKDAVAYFFLNPMTAPILAHLAKRKMEEIGFDYHRMEFLCGEYRFQCSKGTNAFVGEPSENEYIALWTAIREAMKTN